MIQESYDDFLIKIVMNRPELKSMMEKYIHEKVRESFGIGVTIIFEYVENIDRENSGKLRLIKSNVNRAV